MTYYTRNDYREAAKITGVSWLSSFLNPFIGLLLSNIIGINLAGLIGTLLITLLSMRLVIGKPFFSFSRGILLLVMYAMLWLSSAALGIAGIKPQEALITAIIISAILLYLSWLIGLKIGRSFGGR